jgi:hypothetical protein
VRTDRRIDRSIVNSLCLCFSHFSLFTLPHFTFFTILSLRYVQTILTLPVSHSSHCTFSHTFNFGVFTHFHFIFYFSLFLLSTFPHISLYIVHLFPTLLCSHFSQFTLFTFFSLNLFTLSSLYLLHTFLTLRFHIFILPSLQFF